ncbi:MAG TPA: response regulator [Acidimicrobiia bacterium]|nr:response regulator [Acidimicrobiia bacterium]
MANVIVLTDDVWVDNEVHSALSDPGTQIHIISDPRAVVDSVNEHGADAAVIDLQVGSMGGMAVVRALRAAMEAGEIGHVRMVLLLDRSADAFIARRAGADAHVLKPFTAQQLRAAVTLPAEV